MPDEVPHKHRFTLTAHMDGCHFWTTPGHCECGAILTQHGERDPKTDPYSYVWFADDCDRCSELAGGAKPLYRQTVEVPA